MDLHQFYLTPLGHAAMMAKALNCSGRHTVLDPSAGTGVLLDAVKRLQPYSRVNAIERQFGGEIETTRSLVTLASWVYPASDQDPLRKQLICEVRKAINC